MRIGLVNEVPAASGCGLVPPAAHGRIVPRLRVVHVVRQFLPSIGGLEEVVLNLARHQISDLRCDVRVVTLDRLFQQGNRRLPPSESVAGITVTRIPHAGSRRYPFAPQVLRQLGNADLVHVHGVDFFFDFLAWTKPLHKKALVATTHGAFFHTTFAAPLKRAYFASVTRASARFYDRIVACSESDAALFRCISPDNLVTIENGVDIAKHQGRAGSGCFRTLLYFGRLSPHKQIETLFPVLKRLRAASPDWQLMVAGREDGVAVAMLQRLAADAGVADATTIVAGPSDAELGRLVARSTYFVSPSSYEGFGVAAIEAMSAGLVPVLSRIPPFERFIHRARAGLLVDPADADSTADALLRLHARLAAGGLAAERAALLRAAAQHDWCRVGADYLAQYEVALGKRRTRAPAAT